MAPKNTRVTSFAIALLLSAPILLNSCGPAQEGQHMGSRVDEVLDDTGRDRHQMRLELMELRKDIDFRALNTEEEIRRGDLSSEQQRDREIMLQELEAQRNRVQQALIEIDDTDDGAWLDVRRKHKRTTRDIDNWFERQAEKEDLRG